MSHPNDARLAYVYRAFDSYGHLLYIGCTYNLTERLRQHRRASAWHPYAETIGIAGPYPYKEALRREYAAIETEGSYFNTTPSDHRDRARGKTPPSSGGRMRRYLDARRTSELARLEASA